MTTVYVVNVRCSRVSMQIVDRRGRKYGTKGINKVIDSASTMIATGLDLQARNCCLLEILRLCTLPLYMFWTLMTAEARGVNIGFRSRLQRYSFEVGERPERLKSDNPGHGTF